MKTVHKASPAELGESVFDIGYLLFDLIAAIVFFAGADGRVTFLLYGALALLLGGGDAFHLVPRVRRALMGETDRTEHDLGLGLAVSSVTMTLFYVLLYYIWRSIFPEIRMPAALPALIWVSALARVAVCLLPGNNWFHKEGSRRFSLVRNGIFAVTGVAVIALFLYSGNAHGLRLYRMAIAIGISFACYLPVTLFSHTHPKIGMLMIPKTCAYIWMLAMGLGML